MAVPAGLSVPFEAQRWRAGTRCPPAGLGLAASLTAGPRLNPKPLRAFRRIEQADESSRAAEGVGQASSQTHPTRRRQSSVSRSPETAEGRPRACTGVASTHRSLR